MLVTGLHFAACLGAFCQGLTEPSPQGAVTGLSTSIPCDHGRQVEAPFWFIGGIVYEIFSIPLYFPSIPIVNSYTSLSIPNVTFRVDNIVFRCATFDQNGILTPASNAIRLLVSGIINVFMCLLLHMKHTAHT